MAEGEVKIVIDAEDSGVEKKLEDIEDQAKDTGDSLGDLGKEADKGSGGLDLLNVAAGNLVAGGISSLLSGLGDAITSLINLADETREFREDMAKLETAFKDGGHSSEVAQKAYEDFYAILGESDRSVEAVNHLAELTDNTEELSKWSTIAAGVTAKFGDSLPIEGLTEAANETAKVGAVTGPLADALNWAGISEDKFNEALKKCNSEQERATLITNTLNKEYTDAAAEYNTLTASTQAARRATAEMEAAQARLGAAVEPLSTMITTAKSAFFDFAANLAENVTTSIDNAREAATKLNTEERALVENGLAVAEQMRETKLAADEMASGIYSQFNHTQSLADELLRIADANGVVQEADRARVEFILGELNEALGTEYTMTGNVIGNYTKIKDSIYEVIEAKRAQILLQNYEEEYANAISNIAALEEARATQAIALAEAEAAAEETRLEAKRLAAEMEKSIMEDSSRTNIQKWGERMKAANAAADKEAANLERIREEYNKTDKGVEEAKAAINSYEEASTLILQGETEKAMNILNNYGNGFYNTAETVDEANKKELASLEKKVINTSIELGKLEKEYNEKQKNMSTEQKKEMEARIEAAKKEAQDARAEYYKVGGDSIEGLVKGVEDKDGNPIWNLAGKLKNIVAKAIQGAKDEAQIKSPSRKMRKEVGRELIDGAVLGVEDRQQSFMNAMSNVVGGAVAEAKKGAEDAVKALEEAIKQSEKALEKSGEQAERALEDQIEALSEKRTTANAKQIDAQKKALQKELKTLKEKNKEELDLLKEKNKEELEIAKERQKANSDFAKEYENYLTKIEKLEEDYANNSTKIQEKLNEDIAKATENYESAFMSRAQAIQNGLNLFEIAEKGDTVKKTDLKKALKSQVDILKDYNKAISELSARNVKEDFLEAMLGLGVDYLPELEAINKMTDKELDEYVKLWEEKNMLAFSATEKEFAGMEKELEKDIAVLKDVAAKDAETLKHEYNKELLALTREVGGNMAAVGEEGLTELGNQLVNYVGMGEALMNSITEGIENQESSVVNAAVDVVSKAIAAAQREAGIKARLTATVSAENTKYGAVAGNAETEMAQAIVNAVGTQTAGINSLAGQLTKGASSMRPVVIEVDKRELGRAVVDVGNAETSRVGAKVSVGGAK